MAEYYATTKGNKGQATRCGTAKSGIETTTASWKGAIRTTIKKNKKGEDIVTIEQIPWKGNGKSRTIYTGKIGE